MEQEHMLAQESADGRRAKQLMDDPMISGFLKDVKEVTVSKLIAAQNDKDTLDLARFLRVADLFEQRFRNYIETGQIAEHQLSLMEKAKKIFKAA